MIRSAVLAQTTGVTSHSDFLDDGPGFDGPPLKIMLDLKTENTDA